jgi:APA family basic amino acid/polyamine antiporter
VTVPAAASLERRLGPLDAAAIVVSNVIGGGIFFVPVIVARLVPDPLMLLLVWVVGGALSFAGAMAYAELAALRPQSGGEYVYLRDAFGPLAAFLTGWTSFIAGFSGAIAASAVALAEYAGRFIPFAADVTPLATVPLPFASLVISPKNLVALSAIGLLTCAHLRGLGPGRLVQNVLAAAKVTALAAFLIVGFAAGAGRWQHLAGGAGAGTDGFLLALIPVMFAYSGWNAASYVAEEIQSPARNVPAGLGLGTAAVIAIYLGLNALYLYALGSSGLTATDGTLLDRVAEHLFGFVAAGIVAAFTVVSLSASISAMALAGPRVYFAMARDGLFIPAMGRVHPRFRAPNVAIVAQAVWSGVLVLSATLTQLVSYTGFAIVLFSGVAVSAVFVLRLREPGSSRPFHAWGYPWAPAMFVAASAAMVANQLWSSPGTSATGLALIAAGIPVYWMRRGARFREASSAPRSR